MLLLSGEAESPVTAVGVPEDDPDDPEEAFGSVAAVMPAELLYLPSRNENTLNR